MTSSSWTGGGRQFVSRGGFAEEAGVDREGCAESRVEIGMHPSEWRRIRFCLSSKMIRLPGGRKGLTVKGPTYNYHRCVELQGTAFRHHFTQTSGVWGGKVPLLMN